VKAACAGAALLALSLVSGCGGAGSAADFDVDCIAAHLLMSTVHPEVDDTLASISYYYGRLDASSPGGGWEEKAVSRMRDLAKTPDAVSPLVSQCDARMLEETRKRSATLEAAIRAG
jgi:hypothetical protein